MKDSQTITQKGKECVHAESTKVKVTEDLYSFDGKFVRAVGHVEGKQTIASHVSKHYAQVG